MQELPRRPEPIAREVLAGFRVVVITGLARRERPPSCGAAERSRHFCAPRPGGDPAGRTAGELAVTNLYQAADLRSRNVSSQQGDPQLRYCAHEASLHRVRLAGRRVRLRHFPCGAEPPESPHRFAQRQPLGRQRRHHRGAFPSPETLVGDR